MEKKVLALFGSPRKNGNTAALTKLMLSTWENAGISAVFIDVYDKQIAGCRACLGCQKDTEHISCVIDDEMQPILRELETATDIVIAAPIYAWNVPAPMKAVIDRMIYSSCKFYDGDPKGPAFLCGKRLWLVTTCGYPVEKGADLYEEAMKRLSKHCALTYGGMLAERQRNLREPFLDAEKVQRAEEFAKKILEA